MIALLNGQIKDVDPQGGIVLMVGGFGIQALVTKRLLSKVNEGDRVELFTVSKIKEDEMVVYGFESKVEKNMFNLLTAVHGIGPQTALNALDVYNPNDLISIVFSDNPDALCEIPGIGKKTAERIFVELKQKLDSKSVAFGSVPSSGMVTDALMSVKTALVELGYSSDEIRSTLKKLQPHEDEAELLRSALKVLAGSS